MKLIVRILALHISEAAFGARTWDATYLFTAFGIQQDPSELDHFRRVFGDIHTMFITRCSHMNDDITIEIGFLSLRGSHCSLVLAVFRLSRPQALISIFSVGSRVLRGLLRQTSWKDSRVAADTLNARGRESEKPNE